MTPAWQPKEQWLACVAPLTCGSFKRDPGLLKLIVEQFQVETSARYAPMPGVTWCNVFLWDVTRALGCEVDHWRFGKETTANDLHAWLQGDEAKRQGWRLVDKPTAEHRASVGFPTVVSHKNARGPGHVAILVPGPTAASSGPFIAQAGVSNSSCEPLAAGFGSLPVLFFTHD